MVTVIIRHLQLLATGSLVPRGNLSSSGAAPLWSSPCIPGDRLGWAALSQVWEAFSKVVNPVFTWHFHLIDIHQKGMLHRGNKIIEVLTSRGTVSKAEGKIDTACKNHPVQERGYTLSLESDSGSSPRSTTYLLSARSRINYLTFVRPVTHLWLGIW